MIDKDNVDRYDGQRVAVMTKLRGIRYSLILLKIINFIAILFSSSLYLHATNYIIAKGQGYQLLEQLREIPSSPAQNFWISISSWRDSSHYLLSDAPRDTGVVSF